MAELLFYHLEVQPMEQVLPTLLEKTLERGWRAIVQCEREEDMAELSAKLWTYRDDSFLPHIRQGNEGDDRTPIVLTVTDDNVNQSNVRFFVGGARPVAGGSYDRLVYLMDGHDPERMDRARDDWRALKGEFDATYWKQNTNGRWEKVA